MQKVRLGEVCELLNGFAFKSDDYSKKGIPLLRISNFENGNVIIDDKTIYVNSDYLFSKKDFIVEKGDILIALSGATTGKYGIYNYEFPSLLNQRIGLIKSGKSKLLIGKYFFHYLNILRKEILENAGGAAQPNISTKTIADLKIPLPSLEEQKRIATLLDKANELRQKDKALLQKYDALAQSLFLEMFGDPVTNEMGWEKKSLKNVTSKIGSGSTPSGGKESYFASGTSLIRSLNVHDRKFKMKDLAFIDDSQASKLKNVIVESNDILFNITGASVCRCTIVPDEILPARVNQHVSILRAITEILNPEFLCFQIISDNVKRNLYSIATQGGATREAITKDQLEMYEVICPPIELQNQFAEQIKLIEAQKVLVQQNLEKSEGLFLGLLGENFK